MKFREQDWLKFEKEDKGEVRFRDDDVFSDFEEMTKENKKQDHSFQEFVWWDSHFVELKVKHVVSCICSGIDKQPELVKYIKSHPHMEVQIHGWKHKPYFDLSYDECYNDFRKCIEKIKQRFGRIPTIWYPTWNKTGVNSNKAAADLKLEVREKHLTLPEYLGIPDGEVSYIREINFHYWHPNNTRYLESCLYRYTGRRKRGYFWDFKLKRVHIPE